MIEREEASLWRGFQDRFMQLAREEQGLGRADVITKGKALRRMEVQRAHCDYKDYRERVFVAEEVKSFYESLGVELTSEDLSKIEAKMLEWTELEKKAGLKAPETGRWTYGTGAVSENFRERVRLCVVEAGRAHPDYPKGTDPEDFWLHQLYLDLLKNNSDLLFCGTKEGGMILSVCVASATFCARLERKAVTEADRLRTDAKQAESSRGQESANAAPNNTQEAFIDRAIASRKRMLESFGMPEEARNANLPPALDAQKSRALLGIELARLEHLRRGVWKKCFDEARITDVVKTEWQSALSMRKMPDSGLDLGLTFALTKEYEKAISRASAQLADLLATAVGSRTNQAQLREAIWRECLDFAYQLGQWDAFATWVHRAIHIGWQSLDADGQPSLTLDRESETRLEERRKFFEGRIDMYSQEWLSAIDEAIDLRLTVSVAHTVNASGETGKQVKAAKTKSPRIDPEVAKRVALVKANPGIPADEVCETLDREHVPLPAKWLAAGLQTWKKAYKNSDYRSRIDTLISKDRAR
jgi:hypothetical protein